MPITITCKKCKTQQKLTDILEDLKGASSKEENYIMCPKCKRVMIKFD